MQYEHDEQEEQDAMDGDEDDEAQEIAWIVHIQIYALPIRLIVAS